MIGVIVEPGVAIAAQHAATFESLVQELNKSNVCKFENLKKKQHCMS